MSEKVTFDDVYEIAAEVAEETVTKFLKNLVKLVPQAADVVDEIKDSQYEELKKLRQNKLTESALDEQPVIERKSRRQSARQAKPIIPTDDDDAFYDERDTEFAAIAHSGAASDPLDIDDALREIPLEGSNLYSQAMSSAVDNGSIVSNPAASF